MANSSADSDARLHNQHLSVTPPHQIFKDGQGSDNPIPLSPQWLLPKPGESKQGMGTGEGQALQHPYGSRSDVGKPAGNVEGTLDTLKKKDVFRPSLLDMESGRRDRWRDEERDTQTSIRKDRWRNGDKEFGDNRKVDRWDTLGTRHFGDSRRGPSDRWTESGNRDAGFDQRRESKWNSRWGPDDKETEIIRDRWEEAGKDGEITREKGLSLPSGHGKEEREGDHYRPWRSSQSRGRGEPLHNQSMPNKQVPVFSHGRGRGENTPPTFLAGHGRLNSGGSFFTSASTHSFPQGAVFDKGESGHGDLSPVRYSRMKLLDVYRIDTETCQKLPDGFIELPFLTCEKPSEPLALCAPDADELIILKAIDKGEIVSSGAPQTSKDGPSGRNSMDFSQSRRVRPAGSREDIPYAVEEYKDESAEILKTYRDNKSRAEDFLEGNVTLRKADEVPVSRELKEHSMQGNNPVQPVSTWRPSSMGERLSTVPHDWNDTSADVRPRNSDTAWSQPKDSINQWGGNMMILPHSKGESRWQISEDPVLRRQPSSIFDREQEVRKLLPSSPEELSLYYKDPQGQIQGPFCGTDIIGWFEAGYFGIDLPVRLASAPKDSPFSLLGDVMPHLRAKSGPPPGFTGAKQNEFVDAAVRPTVPGVVKAHPGVAEVEMMRSDPRYKHVSATEAENRFIESLMSGGLNNSAQGIQGFAGNNSGGLSLPVVDGGTEMYLLAKKMALERQRSLPSPYSYWPGRDAATVMPGSEGVSENACQPARSPSADLMSLLQGITDRSAPGVNSPVPGWSNFSAQTGVESHQNKVDLPHAQSFQAQTPFASQQQRLQEQNPPLSGLLGQKFENNSPGILTPEMMLASGLNQDPHSLNLLQQQQQQQQQLLLQLNSQTPLTTQQQLLLLDKIVLLKQQQKQEEHQQLLLQQQQLLSQVLSEQQRSQLRFGEPSYGQLQPSLDALRFQPPKDMTQISQQIPVSTAQVEQSPNLADLPQIIHDVSQNVVTSDIPSIHILHQMFGNVNPRISQSTSLPDQIDDIHEQVSRPASITYGKKVSADLINSLHLKKHVLAFEQHEPSNVEEKSEESCQNSESASLKNSMISGDQGVSAAIAAPETCETESLKERANYVNIELDVEREVTSNEPSVETPAPEVKNNEVRESRKISEKKSKKQRANKQSSDQVKGTCKVSLQESKQSETESADVSGTKIKDKRSAVSPTDKTDSQHFKSSTASGTSHLNSEIDLAKGESFVIESSVQNTQAQSGRAWKPAPGFKPKSLLEIQMEEQRRAQAEAVIPKITAPVSSSCLPTPWAGVVASVDPKISREALGDASVAETGLGKPGKIPAPNGKKSHLHDLPAEEVLAKANEKAMEVMESISNDTLAQVTITHAEPVDVDNFIEAKETKKSRKKSAKAKNSGAKVSAPVAVVDTTVAVNPVEKGKGRVLQQEKEVLPAIPSGPSLGDFVLWKGEAVNNPPSAPAWSTDSKKCAKPTSLRDILKEQEKMTAASQPPNPVPTTQKSLPSQAVQGSGLSWSLSATSPSKAAAPIQIHSQASSQSKYKGDDDLFWGPIEQSTQASKQGDFPHITSQNSWGTKMTPGKANPASSLNRQKLVTAGSVDRLSSSPVATQSLLKGKKDAITKHSEANDFRDWCRSECLRLFGSEDTSVLEFCLKLSRSEAETLLIENLGSFDPDHKFIDKFLNYKDLLPAEVLEIAFQVQNNQKGSGVSTRDLNTGNVGIGDYYTVSATDGSSKAGGKKKGKKGKKVSPSVLGFNVVSNRIMMGEIQTIED